MLELNLYSTSHCHLCEQAESLLMSLSEQYDIQWHTIEITEDDKLMQMYGVKIPVIKRTDNNNELNWPFTSEQLIRFLSE